MKFMKRLTGVAIAILGLGHGSNASEDNRAVTKVVKMLEEMLEKSKADADSDREIYAKFKCYCDTQEAKKTQEIEDLTSSITQLESKIEELKGSTGTLSTECAKLRSDMMQNEQDRETATKLRNK